MSEPPPDGRAAFIAAAGVVFPIVPRPTRSSASSLIRAVDHLHAHPELPVTLAQLADIAGVTPRALQYAFRRHYGTTPLGYLQRIRLDHAHRQLLASRPDEGQTVAAIAARWGFTHPGRFAAAYRRVYGTAPHTDLGS